MLWLRADMLSERPRQVRRFGVLFGESTKLGCVGSKTSPGHGSIVLATIRRAISPNIYAINA